MRAPCLRRPSRASDGHGLLLATLFACASGCTAGNLQVAPIVLEFSENQQANALWLQNSADHPINAQIRVQQWSQTTASDQLEPSQVLRASPAIVQIPPGQRQLVRIVRPMPMATAPAQYEQAYRVWVDELPEIGGPQPAGLQFQLRYSIPVFVLPSGAQTREQIGKVPLDTSSLQASWQVSADTLILDVRNTGNQRVRLSELGWTADNGTIIPLQRGLLGYVLAGQRMQWKLPLATRLPLPGHPLARLNDAPVAQILPPAAR
ncbi:fimbrial biogenesis chaperone [Stenotrophomonas sp. UBA7606]|uniref:fimbrial biogenesis chaperone n=1 Tax=Stenotrophomonas sp. UBA7606 TaxID=1947559 RepID=UPI0025FAF579|nr:fimbria/pilus periplasmic chaperone [Stenotrophomonas sp. UBA7606]